MPDSKKPTLLLIDGHSLAFRAFYALPIDSFVTRDGQHTNAIHGFLSMLNLLLQNERPTHLAVAFDKSRVSFRTAEYPEYKGTRGETPSEFKGQIPLLQEALAAMNIPTLQVDNFEADDILATLATRGAAEGFNVLVTSGDRDTLQLVTPEITVLYPNARGVSELKRYDRDAVFEKYGIEPEQYPEIAALVGETSDNLIGIDKVGEKTAVKWIQQYGTVDNLLAHADEITGVVGGYLRDQQDRAIRNRKLNRLVTDMELPLGPADLERKPMDVDAVSEIFGRLQFKALLERLLKIEGVTDETQLTGGGATTSDLPPVRTPTRFRPRGLARDAVLGRHGVARRARRDPRWRHRRRRHRGRKGFGVGAVGRPRAERLACEQCAQARLGLEAAGQSARCRRRRTRGRRPRPGAAGLAAAPVPALRDAVVARLLLPRREPATARSQPAGPRDRGSQPGK